MRPNVKKPICHTILSFSTEDTKRLNNLTMNNLALQYLQKMGYEDTQYLIVRYLDGEHPHVHICINRIDNNKKKQFPTATKSTAQQRSVKNSLKLTN